MNMEQYFSYESAYIPSDEVLKIDERILDDLYSTSNSTEKFNVFFIYKMSIFIFLIIKRIKKLLTYVI